MGFLQSIFDMSSRGFMLVMTIFNVIFFIGVYFSADKYRSILLVAIANILKFISFALYYVKSYENFIFMASLNNLLRTLSVSFMLAAVFTILRFKPRLMPLIFFNTITLLQNIYLELMGSSHMFITGMTAFIISLMFVYSIIVISTNANKGKKFKFPILIVIISMYVVFHAGKGTVFLLGYYNLLGDKQYLIQGFSILCFSAYHMMNLLVIYLNYNYLINKVRELSHRDTLTGALNRSVFFEILDVKLKELKRADEGFALAIIDLDDFKQVNDTYGHLIGDAVLKDFVSYLKKFLRSNDLICRYGGEEFLILIESANKNEARNIITRIQEHMHEVSLTEKNISVTFSCGLEYLEDDDDSRVVQELIKIIDERLYAAKNAGKDCLI